MTELIPFDLRYSNELFELTIKNKDYLKKWLPWLDSIKSEKDTIEFLQKSIMTDYAGTSLNYFITYNGRISGKMTKAQLYRYLEPYQKRCTKKITKEMVDTKMIDSRDFDAYGKSYVYDCLVDDVYTLYRKLGFSGITSIHANSAPRMFSTELLP